MRLLRPSDIVKEYNMTYKTAIKYIEMSELALPRGKGDSILVIQEQWDNWLLKNAGKKPTKAKA